MNSLIYFAKKVRVEINSEELWNILISKPQITLELRNKDIYQARGKINRKPNDNELEIIKLWTEKKGLNSCF